MDKDYTTYSADQLLNDDFFIQSELHPTEKSRAFWSDLQIKSAALSQEIENARLLLHTIKIDRNCSSLAAKDEQFLSILIVCRKIRAFSISWDNAALFI